MINRVWVTTLILGISVSAHSSISFAQEATAEPADRGLVEQLAALPGQALQWVRDSGARRQSAHRSVGQLRSPAGDETHYELGVTGDRDAYKERAVNYTRDEVIGPRPASQEARETAEYARKSGRGF